MKEILYGIGCLIISQMQLSTLTTAETFCAVVGLVMMLFGLFKKERERNGT